MCHTLVCPNFECCVKSSLPYLKKEIIVLDLVQKRTNNYEGHGASSQWRKTNSRVSARASTPLFAPVQHHTIDAEVLDGTFAQCLASARAWHQHDKGIGLCSESQWHLWVNTSRDKSVFSWLKLRRLGCPAIRSDRVSRQSRLSGAATYRNCAPVCNSSFIENKIEMFHVFERDFSTLEKSQQN